MRTLLLSAALIANGQTMVPAHAQSFPSRPVTPIAPFAAGGSVDVAARILSDSTRRSLGQPVIVENMTGAAGTIGVGKVARATIAEGHLVSIGHLRTHGAHHRSEIEKWGHLIKAAGIKDNSAQLHDRRGEVFLQPVRLTNFHSTGRMQ